jgi:hypothetical protein
MPMAKLVTIQSIARALNQDTTAEIFAEALSEWIETRELESECLEALCPLLAITPKPAVIARIRRAISRPSLASDLMLSLATGYPIVLPSWSGRHSGPAPQLLMLDKEEQALRAGTFIPPLFTHNLEDLQERSGRAFLRQWSFEYKVLNERSGGNGDGHLDYFLGDDRNNVGQFVTRKGHLARSAYLRTLACAVERWNMPQDLAQQYAADTFPAEPIFLRLALQPPPSWAPAAHGRTASEIADAQALAHSVIQYTEQLQQSVMHCSLTVVDEPLCHSELEIFAVVQTHGDLDAQRAVGFYRHLLGKATSSRDGLRSFVSPDMGNEDTTLLKFVPILLPLIGPSFGYLQSDFVGRVPYLPVSTNNVPNIELIPGLDGAVLRSMEKEIGTWNGWLWNWKPSHARDWSAPIASHVGLQPKAAQQIADDLGGRIAHVWSLTTWQRDQPYGEWRHIEQVGRINT